MEPGSQLGITAPEKMKVVLLEECDMHTRFQMLHRTCVVPPTSTALFIASASKSRITLFFVLILCRFVTKRKSFDKTGMLL